MDGKQLNNQEPTTLTQEGGGMAVLGEPVRTRNHALAELAEAVWGCITDQVMRDNFGPRPDEQASNNEV